MKFPANNMGCLLSRPSIPSVTNAETLERESPKLQMNLSQSYLRKAGTIQDAYKVIKVLGVGPLGEVKLVEHKTLQHQMAMKEIRKDKIAPNGQILYMKQLKIVTSLHTPSYIEDRGGV